MNAVPTAEATDAAVALAAATAAARLLPAVAPLMPVPAPAGQRPDADALAVVASFVGPNSADVVLVADEAVREALAAGAPDGSPLDLDAVRRRVGRHGACRIRPGAGLRGSGSEWIALGSCRRCPPQPRCRIRETGTGFP